MSVHSLTILHDSATYHDNKGVNAFYYYTLLWTQTAVMYDGVKIGKQYTTCILSDADSNKTKNL